MLVQAGTTSLLMENLISYVAVIAIPVYCGFSGRLSCSLKPSRVLPFMRTSLKLRVSLLHCFLFVCSKQLEKELLEQQLKVNSLQELTAYLLLKSDGDYVEADEKVHVIGKKLKQLIEQVSNDLKTIQGNLVSQSLNSCSWIFLTEK